VYLAESLTCFGGTGTAGMLPVFMGFGDSVNFYADGFGREIYDRLFHLPGGAEYAPARRPAAPDVRKGDLGPRYRVECLKRVYDEIAADSGFDFTFQTTLLDVRRAGDVIDAAICGSKSGLFGVSARVFVDATGDGDLCARAGAPFEKGDANGDMQPGTLCSLWCDIDWARAEAAGVGQWRQQDALHRAQAEGRFPINDPHLPGMVSVGPATGGGNIGHAFGVDGTDERSLTDAILHTRRILAEYGEFYRGLPGYERTWLAATGSLFGVRDSRRILGDYVLNAADYDAKAVFDDEIGRYNYWVDIHPLRPTKEEFTRHISRLKNRPFEPGESYGIPYRILTVRGLRNALTAGRCVSADHQVQASIRVMPGCYITGQAAGMAAAIACERHSGDVRAFPVTQLQQRLKAMGAFLPNYAG